ncbi:MAG: zinc ribbon domain-containing protein [Oscillospiraceae bacterium]|nr:zinc ribbon domain-containing protein [Oscillospiraceae bacterium]
MAFFDKIGGALRAVGSKTNDIAKNVTEKTGDAIEITKLNGKINVEKAKIAKQYADLGEYCYEQFAAVAVMPGDAHEFCSAIDESNEIIAEALADIEKLKSKPEEFVGEAEEEAEEETPEAEACPCCGCDCAEEANFCANCGAKLR